MKKNLTILVVLIVLLVLFVLIKNHAANTTNLTATSTPTVTLATTTVETIQVSNPSPNTGISSPLTITGTAPQNWFFEASFPISLRDGTGKEISRVNAQATDDWTQSDPVHFKAVMTFVKPSTATGTLVFQNDNPSGDPARDKTFIVPIVFDLTAAQQTSSTQTVNTTVTATVRITPTGQ